jgi:hypothetical protein
MLLYKPFLYLHVYIPVLPLSTFERAISRQLDPFDRFKCNKTGEAIYEVETRKIL